MNEIESYLSSVKKAIVTLKGDITLIEEFRSSILEEWKDYKQENPNIPVDELEKKFIIILESPVEIAKSLMGEKQLADRKEEFWFRREIRRLFNNYKEKVMTNSLGSLFTYFMIWMIPGMIYLIDRFEIPNIFKNVLWPLTASIDSLINISLFKPVSFTFYTIGDPFLEYRVLYTYPIVPVILFALFILYLYKFTRSLLELCTIIVVSAFSFVITLFFVEVLTVLTGVHTVLPQFDPIIPRLFMGYTFFLGSLLYMSILIMIVIVTYDTLRSYPIQEDYSLLINLVLDRKSAFFTALIINTVSFSPKILTILDSPNVFHIYHLALTLFLLASIPIFILVKAGFKYGTKVIVYQIIILIPLWISITINLGIFVSIIILGAIIYNLKIRNTNENGRKNNMVQ